MIRRVLDRVDRTIDGVTWQLFGDDSWMDVDLTDWCGGHGDPHNGVWVVRTPGGGEEWQLFRPGSGYPHGTLRPDTVRAATGEAREGRHPSLARHEAWIRRWIEDYSGRRVVDIAEGWSERYGADSAQEYVIYAQVAR